MLQWEEIGLVANYMHRYQEAKKKKKFSVQFYTQHSKDLSKEMKEEKFLQKEHHDVQMPAIRTHLKNNHLPYRNPGGKQSQRSRFLTVFRQMVFRHLEMQTGT